MEYTKDCGMGIIGEENSGMSLLIECRLVRFISHETRIGRRSPGRPCRRLLHLST